MVGQKLHRLLDAADAQQHAGVLDAAEEDPELRSLAEAVEASPAWANHCTVVAKGLATPEYHHVRVAELLPRARGEFAPATRTLYLDRLPAADVIDAPSGALEPTALHELVHAAQRLPSNLPRLNGQRPRLDRWLLEGATDLMAAHLYHDHSSGTGPLDLPGRHGPRYGPFEAVTEGLMATLTTPETYMETLREYTLLRYGTHLRWVRRRLLRPWHIRQNRALPGVLYGLMAVLPSDDYFARMMQGWALAERTTDILTKDFKRR